MKYAVIFSLLMLVSCKQSVVEADPTNVLDKSKFVEVLKDKALAEAALNVNAKNVGGEKYDSVYNFNIYGENGVTKAQFDSTMKFYSARPDELKELMDSVLQSLNLEKAKR